MTREPNTPALAEDQPRGAIAWMARNRVTPNLLMICLLVGGLYMATRIKQEVFPEFDEDMVTVSVAYPGASPEEVERGIILAIEEAVRGLDGVEEINATAGEGSARVNIELLSSADDQKVYQDIQQEIDRITTFPEDAEEPEVSLQMHRRQVLILQIYGDANEWALREYAEQLRDRLLLDPGITQVDFLSARDYEVHIEVPQESLRAYDLTLDKIAQKISTTAIEIPGGSVKTSGGEILLRVKERRDWAGEFADIPVVASPTGSILRLDDIATIRDGFQDTDHYSTYNRLPAVVLAVYRIGDQTPMGVSEAARRVAAEFEPELPPGVSCDVLHDMSEVYRQRLELLMKNGLIGFVLVLALLGVFLEFKLAFWVTMGIPVSFLGGLLFLPGMDVTINMMSMFAFIIALGIVVDDAIVAGENIYEYRTQGMGFIEAAIRGARDVAMPITYSILTNVVAFLPLAFVPGVVGKIFRVIPLVVITVFMISLVEALFILPAHLGHTRSQGRTAVTRYLHGRQEAFSRLVSRMIEKVYGPFLEMCLHARMLTLAISLAVLTIVVAYVLSGRIGMILMPRSESDEAAVTAVLPYGSPLAKTTAVRDRLIDAAEKVIADHGGEQLAEGIEARIGENQVDVVVYLTDADTRPISTGDVTRLWREEAGAIVGLQSIIFESDRMGPGRGAGLTVELSHRDIDVLDQASAELAEILSQFDNTKDIDDGYSPGKEQLDFKLKPEAYSLGLTASEIARQVRNAFYGAEALRQQRGRNEIKVRVRLPESQRISEYDVEQLLIRTPAGRDVPLRQVAEVTPGRAYTTITRRNARRTVTVTANVEPIDEVNQVQATLDEEILPRLEAEYPGLTCGYEGRQADMTESLAELKGNFVLALLAIYALLAIPFRSYLQPVIVMTAIPFGVIGAVIGHLIMGYSLSVISMMGIVALSGVVVNDALVMIEYANRRRAAGESPHDAIHAAGVRRFRPIMLTTLTTFGGLTPMILETSRQARMMIPMAISLGFGILFATAITLIIVPCLYLLAEDSKEPMRRVSSLAAFPAGPEDVDSSPESARA